MAMEKLVIKIRMPSGGSELPFECPTCHRSFKSGKGLGGHKRVHLREAAAAAAAAVAATGENRSENPLVELQIVSHPQANAAAGGQGTLSDLQIIAQPQNNADQNTHPCPICQKPWPSLKSVHGHMRKHRGRNWRGMIPPAPPAAVGNGEQLLLEGNTSADHQGGGDELALVVVPDVQPPPPPEPADRRRRPHGKAPAEMVPEADKDSIGGAYDLIALSTGESSSKEGYKPKKKKQKLEIENPGPVVISGGTSKRGITSLFPRRRKFACDICHKSFRTYQAMGGHKSHHFLEGEASSSTARDDGGDKHEVVNENPTVEAPVNEVPSGPGGEKNKDSKPNTFPFDLNEIPPLEED